MGELSCRSIQKKRLFFLCLGIKISLVVFFFLRSQSTFEKKRVAILISGGLSRFIFRDSLQGISFPSIWRRFFSFFPPEFDVYIVLHNVKEAVVHLGSLEPPPYLLSTNSSDQIQQLKEDIRTFYLSLGAGTVEITILSKSEIQKAIHQVTESTLLFFNESQEVQRELKYIVGTGKWTRNLMMYYLRHKAYLSLIETELRERKRYSHVFYLREDTMFYGPANEEKLPLSDADVIVDHHCSFGAYSDKIYFLNRKGAHALFSPTREDFQNMIYSWVQEGLSLQKQKHRNHFLQTERFLQFWLENKHGLVVKKYPFFRVDGRFVNKTLCIPSLYYTCAKISRSKLQIAPCEKTKQREEVNPKVIEKKSQLNQRVRNQSVQTRNKKIRNQIKTKIKRNSN